jgi:hypothetical protein
MISANTLQSATTRVALTAGVGALGMSDGIIDSI